MNELRLKLRWYKGSGYEVTIQPINESNHQVTVPKAKSVALALHPAGQHLLYRAHPCDSLTLLPNLSSNDLHSPRNLHSLATMDSLRNRVRPYARRLRSGSASIPICQRTDEEAGRSRGSAEDDVGSWCVSMAFLKMRLS